MNEQHDCEEDHSKKVQEVLDRLPNSKHFPNKLLHVERNYYIHDPHCCLVSEDKQTFVDNCGSNWVKMPWHLNMMHNPIKNVKLINYDTEHHPDGLGSSEIIVAKKNIQTNIDGKYRIDQNDVRIGNYNIRDFKTVSHWRHFIADILPNFVYFKCVGNSSTKDR